MSTVSVLDPLAFDPSRAAWVEDRAAPRVEDPRTSLTVVTWNVWFGPYCFESRFRALLDIVRAQRPDIICFQEITRQSLQMLLAEPWIRDEYRTSDACGDTFEAYGVLLLSRFAIRSLTLHRLPSKMGRRFLLAELETRPDRLVVGTVHLESLEANGDLRAEQLGKVFPLLRAAGSNAVLAGDFNFCASSRTENARLDQGLVDVWSALRGSAPGHTEDTDVNVMLRKVKGRQKPVRFDRILLRSAGGAFQPRSIERLGTAPIAASSPDVFPSDHFGLVASIERPPARAPGRRT